METAPGTGESRRVVLIALAANVGIAIAFGIAAAVTGATSMFAQTVHAIADTGNQSVLLVAQRRSLSHRDGGRLLAGREAYFWALIAAVGVFVIGATLSVREGVAELFDPEPATAYWVAYTVLGIAMLLDGFSWLNALRTVRREAKASHRDVLEQVVRDSDPTTRAVFGEDGAALLGDVIALVGIGLQQATGSSVPDALGSIAIGGLLGSLAVFLAARNRDFLVGQSIDAPERAALERLIEAHDAVASIEELVVTYVGPRQLWVVARVRIDDEEREVDEPAVTRELEAAIEGASPAVLRADVVPL